MDQSPPKTNVYSQLAKRKAEAQKAGNKFGAFGKNPSSRFPHPEKSPAFIPRGGRNGNGKP